MPRSSTDVIERFSGQSSPLGDVDLLEHSPGSARGGIDRISIVRTELKAGRGASPWSFPPVLGFDAFDRAKAGKGSEVIAAV